MILLFSLINIKSPRTVESRRARRMVMIRLAKLIRDNVLLLCVYICIYIYIYCNEDLVCSFDDVADTQSRDYARLEFPYSMVYGTVFSIFHFLPHGMGLGDLKNWLVELLPPGYRACETYSTPYD
jgi:hypothetical protein